MEVPLAGFLSALRFGCAAIVPDPVTERVGGAHGGGAVQWDWFWNTLGRDIFRRCDLVIPDVQMVMPLPKRREIQRV